MSTRPFRSSSEFLSTPSGWRATFTDGEGEDELQFLSTPSGWRATDHHSIIPHAIRFLSTPSGWRATAAAACRRDADRISIHALRVEGDHALQPRPPVLDDISIHALRVEGDKTAISVPKIGANFYPRPPGGGRLYKGLYAYRRLNFYPRPPGGGRRTR